MNDFEEMCTKAAADEGVPDIRKLMAQGLTNEGIIEAILPGFVSFYRDFLSIAGENQFKRFMAEVTLLALRQLAMGDKGMALSINQSHRELVVMAFTLGRYSVIKAKH